MSLLLFLNIKVLKSDKYINPKIKFLGIFIFPLAICFIMCYIINRTICADVAHLVERHLAKVEVAGSSPVIRSIFL